MGKRKQAKSLEQVLTQEAMVEIAGDRYFQRGETYFRRGYVHDLAMEGDRVVAQVSGTYDYSVELWAEDGELQATCTCPLGEDDLFCKHCVAVGLTWLANPSAAKSQKNDRRRPTQKPVTMQDVQHFLEQQEKSTLIQWIMARSQQDNDWQQQLLLRVASHQPQGLDITTFRRALREAISVRDFIDWDEVHNYADHIGAVFDSVQALLETNAPEVIELCEYAIPMIETAMNSIDDSSGYVSSLLEEFAALHYDACEIAKPNPVVLAERLLKFELDSDFGSFSDAVFTYASILGEEGLTHYRQRAEALWEECQPLSAKQAGEWNYKRHKLQRILEALVEESGDIEAIVEIKQRDLSNSQVYVEIAQLYLEDGQRDRALEWAEKGLKSFDSSSSLRQLVIEEYHRQGRIDEAMELVWQAFSKSVTLRSYETLIIQAERVNQWQIWRDKALDYIRQQLEPPQPPPGSRKADSRSRRRAPAGTKQAAAQRSVYTSPLGIGVRDRSLLVEIFLWEGKDDLAWQEAQAGGCSKQLWLTLADRRQHTHPADALPIYQRQIEPLIQETNNSAYARAISYLQKVHDLMIQLNQQANFKALVSDLRQTYKAKRNFIALLNQQKW